VEIPISYKLMKLELQEITLELMNRRKEIAFIVTGKSHYVVHEVRSCPWHLGAEYGSKIKKRVEGINHEFKVKSLIHLLLYYNCCVID